MWPTPSKPGCGRNPSSTSTTEGKRSNRNESEQQSVITACKYAVEGRSLYESPDPQLGPLQLVLVGMFRPKDQESPARVNRVLQDHGVKLFRTSDLPRLLDEIRRTGKDFDGENET
jgi:hypothetical protein